MTAAPGRARHLTLVRLPSQERSPPLDEHGGRQVTWDEWETALRVTHIEHECEQCGYSGQPLTAAGTVLPLPGEMVTAFEEKHPGGCAREVRRPARPVRRLFAYRCPECRADTVYDWGDDGNSWVTVLDPSGQAALF